MRHNFWYYFVNFWTVIVFVAVIYDFIRNNTTTEVLNPLLVIYIAVLTIYVGAKEFERWFDYHTSMHPGEVHVLLWTALVVSLSVLTLVFRKPYVVSEELISTYIAVIGIFAITQKSKALHKEKVESDS